MQRFTELRVWQRSHALILAIYRLTVSLPVEERFHLVNQVRRAATAVATNIAEGAKKEHRRDYARFLNIAEGSIAETEYLLFLTADLGYAETSALQKEAEEISRMLSALRHHVLMRDREERRERVSRR